MSVELDESQVAQFFADARERHAIYLRRRAGQPKPWTDDPVMQNYKITNVFRELDRTTTWIRTHVRDPLYGSTLALPAVALARWFNLIPTLETVFLQPSLFPDAGGATGVGGAAPDPNPRAGGAPDPAPAAGSAAGFLPVSGSAAGLPPVSGSAAGLLPTEGAATPWQRWLKTEDTRDLEWPLRKQGAPWVTGAYMIRTPIGMDKLEGVLSSFRNLWTQRPKFELNSGKVVSMGWGDVAQHCLDARDSERPVSLERMHDWLCNFYGLGPFMAHEIVIDLRHTALLDRAPDIRSWTNPGPGALRGANILIRGAKQGRKGRLEKSSVAEAKDTILQLQDLAQDPKYWPQEIEGGFAVDPSYPGQIEDVLRYAKSGDWPQWEMHQGEMMLCEYTKITRTRLGFGRPRGNYPGVS